MFADIHPPLRTRLRAIRPRAAREARAAAFENKLAPKKGRDREQIKAENWRKYDAIGKEKEAVVAAVPAPWVPPVNGGHVLGSAPVTHTSVSPVRRSGV